MMRAQGFSSGGIQPVNPCIGRAICLCYCFVDFRNHTSTTYYGSTPFLPGTACRRSRRMFTRGRSEMRCFPGCLAGSPPVSCSFRSEEADLPCCPAHRGQHIRRHRLASEDVLIFLIYYPPLHCRPRSFQPTHYSFLQRWVSHISYTPTPYDKHHMMGPTLTRNIAVLVVQFTHSILSLIVEL